MTGWVLIFFLGFQAPAAGTAVFADQASCEAAAETVKARLSTKTAFCLPQQK